MTRTWTVGVDAGGTWLRVMATDGSGRRWTTKERAAGELSPALHAIWRRRRVRPATVAHLVLAARGVWTTAERRAAVRRLRGLARRISVLSDVEAAYHGAIGDRAGLLVLAGTGSIVLARSSNGIFFRAGGLGPLFGDGGSAFALGRDWLAAVRPLDARRVARAPDAVARIAALAPRVLRLSRRGDGPARLAVARGSLMLALDMRAAAGSARLSGPITVSWAGSLLEDRGYRDLLWRTARRLGLRLTPIAPKASALEAAAHLAARSAATVSLASATPRVR
ncbi:MAG TPA: BadF/BadG/BcrA/BcrD ATPase family protein [Terriglobales bacterium]|nr:BadF/BadG/BcrA/BcrD ATPase family protein [Terriglobales bacterium]